MIKLVEADGWYLVDVAPAHRAEHPEAGGYPMEDPMSGYVVVVERDEVGGFSTWSPDLPGCVAADRDYDECLRLMTEAVHLHLEGMQADGDPVPEPTAMTALVIPAA